MDRYNICIGESYEGKNGEKKVSWKAVGEMFTAKNGKRWVKLYMFPGQLLGVFPVQERNAENEPEAKNSDLPF
jgi:hypothetical protein